MCVLVASSSSWERLPRIASGAAAAAWSPRHPSCAFARTPPARADSQQPAARLLLSVDRRLTSRERSVLSGEKTYALDLDVLEQIAATTAVSPSVDDGDEARAADWQGVEQASVVLLLSAVRAVSNIDSGGLAAAPSATAPTAVIRQLRVIVD
jgi:hypothetical protein